MQPRIFLKIVEFNVGRPAVLAFLDVLNERPYDERA